MNLNPKNRSVSLQKRLKMFYFHHFKVFTRCRLQNVSVRVPFPKSAVFKICRQKMCRFRVNRRPIRRIFHRFQNVPASCERSLRYRWHTLHSIACQTCKRFCSSQNRTEECAKKRVFGYSTLFFLAVTDISYTFIHISFV